MDVLWTDSALALGSRSTGLGKVVQEPWAEFKVARDGEWLVIGRRYEVTLFVSSSFIWQCSCEEGFDVHVITDATACFDNDDYNTMIKRWDDRHTPLHPYDAHLKW